MCPQRIEEITGTSTPIYLTITFTVTIFYKSEFPKTNLLLIKFVYYGQERRLSA